MYEIIKSVIKSGNYELRDIIFKIDKRCLEGTIAEEERDELIAYARENANAKNSYAPLQEQIEKLAFEIKLLKAEVDALKNGGTVEQPAEEYPEYVQPTGGHDAYKAGAKVTYEGNKYVCQINDCVWSPKDYPRGWSIVTE